MATACLFLARWRKKSEILTRHTYILGRHRLRLRARQAGCTVWAAQDLSVPAPKRGGGKLDRPRFVGVATSAKSSSGQELSPFSLDGIYQKTFWFFVVSFLVLALY